MAAPAYVLHLHIWPRLLARLLQLLLLWWLAGKPVRVFCPESELTLPALPACHACLPACSALPAELVVSSEEAEYSCMDVTGDGR